MMLSSNGKVLETSPAEFGEFRDANDLLGDVEAPRDRMGEDGCLLFRGLLDRDTVPAARVGVHSARRHPHG